MARISEQSRDATPPKAASKRNSIYLPGWTSACRRHMLGEPYKLGRRNVDDANHSLLRKR